MEKIYLIDYLIQFSFILSLILVFLGYIDSLLEKKEAILKIKKSESIWNKPHKKAAIRAIGFLKWFNIFKYSSGLLFIIYLVGLIFTSWSRINFTDNYVWCSIMNLIITLLIIFMIFSIVLFAIYKSMTEPLLKKIKKDKDFYNPSRQ